MKPVPLRASFGALVCIALAIGTQVAARADVGAGVGASPIVLASVATLGNTYTLPSLYVVNTGTVTSSYRLSVEQFAPHQGLAVPAGWVTFARNDFPLQPKQSTSVAMTLTVPSAAVAGAYQSDLVAGTVPPRTSSGAIAGAQAATKLTFTVGSGGGFPWPWPWWSYAVLAIALLITAVMALQRRFHFRLLVVGRR